MYKYSDIKKFIDNNSGKAKEIYTIDYNLLCRINQMYHELEGLKLCYERVLENQQKEFIEYLKEQINECKLSGNDEDYVRADVYEEILNKIEKSDKQWTDYLM